MKAFVVDRYKSKSAVRFGEMPEPQVRDDDVLALKPKNLTMEEAASIPLVGLTAWQGLIERANLKQGQEVWQSTSAQRWRLRRVIKER